MICFLSDLFKFCNKKQLYKLYGLRVVVKLSLTEEASGRETNLGESSQNGLLSGKELSKDYGFRVNSAGQLK